MVLSYEKVTDYLKNKTLNPIQNLFLLVQKV